MMEETLARSLHNINTLWKEISGLELTAWRGAPPFDLPEFVYKAAISDGQRIRQVRGTSGNWWIAQAGHDDQTVFLASREYRDITPQFLRWSLALLDQVLDLHRSCQGLAAKHELAKDRIRFLLDTTQAAAMTGAKAERFVLEALRDLPGLLGVEEAFILHRTQGITRIEKADEGEPEYLNDLIDMVDDLDASVFQNAAFDERIHTSFIVGRDGRRTKRVFLTPIPTKTPSRTVLVASAPVQSKIDADACDFIPKAARQMGFLSQLVAATDGQTQERRLDHELHVSSQIQENFLPNELPSIPGVDFAAILQPAHHVGGDFYDVLRVENGLVILIGDVAGKGIPAAILTALIHATLKSESRHESQPAKLLSGINDLIYDELDRSGTFITAFLALLQTDPMQLTYASAGHTTALVWEADHQDVVQLGSTGLPLGITPKATFSERTLELHPGDGLVLYSDGITEAENAVGRVFGAQALIDLLTATHSSSAQQQLETIIRALDLHRGSLPLIDDVVLLLAQVQEAPAVDHIHSEPFVYLAKKRNVRQIAQFARQAASRLPIEDPELASRFLAEWELAVSEIATNIVLHAYRDTPYTGRIQGRFGLYSNRVQMDIIDSGVKFMPKEMPAYDPSDPPVRGYGLMLANQLLDTCAYKRLPAERNHWRLEKRLDTFLDQLKIPVSE